MCPVMPVMAKALAGYGLMMCTALEMKKQSMSALTVDGAYKTVAIGRMLVFIAMVSMYVWTVLLTSVILSIF